MQQDGEEKEKEGREEEKKKKKEKKRLPVPDQWQDGVEISLSLGFLSAAAAAWRTSPGKANFNSPPAALPLQEEQALRFQQVSRSPASQPA